VKKLYFRCNGGHYFRSSSACPFDGWSCDGIEDVIDRFEKLKVDPDGPSIKDLRDSGVSEAALERVLIIDFGSDASAFEALVPERYLHHGRELLAHEVGKELY
jgi:hypothetical protein